MISEHKVRDGQTVNTGYYSNVNTFNKLNALLKLIKLEFV